MQPSISIISFLALHDGVDLPASHSCGQTILISRELLVLQPQAHPRDTFPVKLLPITFLHPYPPPCDTLLFPCSLLLSLAVCFTQALSLFPPPCSNCTCSLCFFPLKSPLQHFSNARVTVGFRGLLGMA